MTAREVAAYLNIKVQTLWKMNQDEKGPPSLLLNRRRRYRREDVDRWLEREGS